MDKAKQTILRHPEQKDVIEAILKLNPNLDKGGQLWVRDTQVAPKWVKTEGAWPLFRRYENPLEIMVCPQDPNDEAALDAA